jgi:phenylalanyl-tRNA synthetase beta chain
MSIWNEGADERYMCRDPKQIKFAPLNRDTEHTAEELMTIFEVR